MGTMRPFEDVSHHIRKLILEGKLKPGIRIYESRIAKEKSISQGVVREVLRELAARGIVEITPYKGCRVTTLTREDLSQINKLRQPLETKALEQAKKNMTDEDLRELRELITRMTKAGRYDDAEIYYDFHAAFHQRVWQIARNPHLVRALVSTTSPLLVFSHPVRTGRGDTAEDYGASTHQIFIEALQGEKEASKSVAEHISAFEYQTVELTDAVEK